MGTFQSAAALAAKFNRVEKDLQRAPEVLVKLAGDIVAREIKQKASGLRFPRSKPTKLGAKVDTRNTNAFSVAQATVSPAPRGLWTILEEGAESHLITSKYAGGSRRGRAKRFLAGGDLGGGSRAVLNIPGIGYRRYAVIPKTRAGRAGTWEAGIKNSFSPVLKATGFYISGIIEKD